MLLLTALILAMMQQISVAEGFDCSKVSCTEDCPLDFFKRYNQQSPEVFIHLKNATLTELYKSQPRVTSHNSHLLNCCGVKCRNFCLNADDKIVPNGHSWTDMNDPCLEHICYDGVISNQTSLCSGIPCPKEHHIIVPGDCCPSCSSDWANFCSEDEFCDIACEFGFAVDAERGCDLCRCARRKTETTTSSPIEFPTSNDDAPPRIVHFYFYLDPTDDTTKILLIGIAIALSVVFVGCLAAIGWYFHRRIYKQVPLLSLRNSSA